MLNYTSSKIFTTLLIVIILPLVLKCELIDKKLNYNDLNVILTSRDSIFYHRKQPYSGLVNHFDSSKKMLRQFELLSGKLSGVYKTFDSDENIILLTHYHQGKLHGTWKAFKKGVLVEKVNYNYGLIDGQRKSYWENGLIKEENNYVLGLLTGTSKFYFSNGQLRKIIGFDTYGNPHGDWIDYSIDGQIKGKVSYNFGKIIVDSIR